MPVLVATAVPATVAVRPKFLAIPGDECQDYAADGDGSQDTGRERVTSGIGREWPTSWSRVPTWCGWCARCRSAPPHAPASAPPAAVPLPAPRRRQHATRRPVGAGRCQATYPLRSRQSSRDADCRPRACGRPRLDHVAPGATTGVLDTCRAAPGRRGRRAPTPGGARRPAGGTPLAGRPPVRQPHACPSRRARCSRQRRRSPCRRPCPWPAPPWRPRPPAVRTGSGWRGSLAPAWARAEHAPRARAQRRARDAAEPGPAVGSGLSTRVTRATAGAPLPGLRMRHACAHAHRRAAGPRRDRSVQRQHTRGGRHLSYERTIIKNETDVC